MSFKHTRAKQRREFYQRHEGGETYQEIADASGVSKECVRYWCRRQRDGGDCQSRYRREPGGLLGRFDGKVRYVILRLRLEHPRWGPGRIRHHLGKRRSLAGLALPSPAAIGRYLHQWPRFRRRRRAKPAEAKTRPQPAVAVHQRWQLDFKVDIQLEDGSLVHLYTICDEFSSACLGADVFVTQRGRRPTLAAVMACLRRSFARWQTLPAEIQTDGETVLTGRHAAEMFPSRFTLWLIGLGINHRVIRSGQPTDNAQVERCHQTVCNYAIVGQEDTSVAQLQTRLEQAVAELAFELPSRAKTCQGLPPAVAHPSLSQPALTFQPEHELAHFDLRRVDAYLAARTWSRLVSATGQVAIGEQRRYTVGRAYAGQEVLVRFDPADRHFIFATTAQPDVEICRRPARGLQVSDLTGIEPWPFGHGLQQLPLPFLFAEGVNC